MSFYDDYVAEGLCCECCGGFLDGSEPGFSRLCAGCKPRKTKSHERREGQPNKRLPVNK